MYGIRFFETFWKIFVFLKNYSTEFQKSKKSGTNGESGRYPVCLLTPLVSFYLTPFSTAFEKVTPIFEFFKTFKNYPPKSGILVSIEWTGCRELLWVSGYAQFFRTKKL